MTDCNSDFDISAKVKNPLFTNEEVIKLLKLVKRFPDTYISYSDKIDQRERAAAWRKVTEEFNKTGLQRHPHCIKVKFRGLKSQYKYKKSMEARARNGEIVPKHIKKPVLPLEAVQLMDEILEEEAAALEEQEFFGNQCAEVKAEEISKVEYEETKETIVEYDPDGHPDFYVEYLEEEYVETSDKEDQLIQEYEEEPKISIKVEPIKRKSRLSQNITIENVDIQPQNKKIKKETPVKIPSSPSRPFQSINNNFRRKSWKLSQELEKIENDIMFDEEEQIPTSTSRISRNGNISSSIEQIPSEKRDTKLSNAQAEYFRDKNIREERKEQREEEEHRLRMKKLLLDIKKSILEIKVLEEKD